MKLIGLVQTLHIGDDWVWEKVRFLVWFNNYSAFESAQSHWLQLKEQIRIADTRRPLLWYVWRQGIRLWVFICLPRYSSSKHTWLHWFQLFENNKYAADRNKKSDVESADTGRPLLWDGWRQQPRIWFFICFLRYFFLRHTITPVAVVSKEQISCWQQ